MKAAASAIARENGRVDGSFMRLEVISMLKLAYLSFIATLLVALFVSLGYLAAPEVAKSDWTTADARCTSEFSLDLLTRCADQHDVRLPATVGNSSGAVVDTLLKLPVVSQVNVLTCMLELCSSQTMRPVAVDDPELLRFAHYSFRIDGVRQRNRYFYLEVSIPNGDTTTDHAIDLNVIPQVRGFYRNKTRDLVPVPLLPASRVLPIHVDCRKGAIMCDSAFFLRFTDIVYEQYKVDVLFNATASDVPLPFNGRDPQFRKTWGSAAFTNWMIGVKMFFLVLAIAMVVWYNSKLNMLSLREQNLEQGWVVALGASLVLFNDPFYIAEAATGGDAFRLLSLLFQVTFFQMLLLFWLVALDNMRLQGRESGVSNACFFVPKVLFITVFWFFMVLYYGYIKFYGNNDLTWDPLATNARFSHLRAFVGICSVVYLAWFVVLCVLSHKEFKSKRPRYRYLLALSFVLVIVCFAGLGAGSFSPTPRSAGAWTSFMALFNVYVLMLSYLYAPSATTLRNARQRNEMHGKDADPEASPALGDRPGAIDVQDVEAQGLHDENELT
ncbi:hypothetical protein ATCC90586_009403 [Pythium insidiosum]|nr:hypothetical protein ATCC90586_009403 [Pythium insidiosum]